jgi:hypothetical protein
MNEQAMKAIERAIAEARLAYRFAPGSYTFAVLTECLTARDALHGVSWIEEYLAYGDAIETIEQITQQTTLFAKPTSI